MAYETFIPRVEVAKLLEEREPHLTFVANCTRKWEGEIKKKGDSITLKVAGTPTIYHLEKDGTYTANQVGTGSVAGSGKDVIHSGLPDAEEIENAEIKLAVNQIETWNYMIGDIDAEQSEEKGLMPMYRKKTAKKLAEVQDKFVAKTMAGFTGCQHPTYTSAVKLISTETKSKNASSTEATNEVYVLDFLDDLVVKMNERNVEDGTPLVFECTPKVWSIIKKAYRDLDTDNSAMLNGRKCGVYNDIKIVKSNNAIVDVSGTPTEYCFLRTQEAVAFFDPLTKRIAYDLEKGFSDCEKGYSLYDAGLVYPNEVIVTAITHTSLYA
jgi:hypothetical protein